MLLHSTVLLVAAALLTTGSKSPCTNRCIRFRRAATVMVASVTKPFETAESMLELKMAVPCSKSVPPLIMAAAASSFVARLSGAPIVFCTAPQSVEMNASARPSECDAVIRRATVSINRSSRLPRRENNDGVAPPTPREVGAPHQCSRADSR